MEVVNSMVKGGQFTPQLANAIFALCQQLKQHGPTLEQTHKSDLNKAFVSLRQACCRDHGQLGTPCRLKIMELVELRAMHWRSNLAHSQYYVNRPEQHDSLGASSPLSMGFHTPSMAPTTFSPSLFLPDMSTQTTQATHQTSPYFLIPAAGGFMNPLLPGLLQQPLFASALAQNQAAAAEVLLRNKQIKKPTIAKPMQLRHEMVIRNADSGKIMGVKGRRVALVEQITNTVISFQKVDPKAKERTLTITASTTEAIEHAKQLVEETIRRNTSPVRPEAAALLGMGIGHSMSTDSPSMGDDESSGDEDDREPQRGQDISIETTQDGVLKLCCSDPHVLQAAQEALSEYLRMRTRSSAEEREKKKERRKSMPLQTAVKEEKVETTERRPGLERARSLGGSTPNLQEQANKAAMASRMRAPFGPCYGREALLAQQNPGENDEIINQVINQVSQIAPEILRDSVQN
ncbi:unnamed protein product, partial [Mesorhabditis belari]|uniref:K Homology domain-containing protein n=1 Tax=Mesorhabditis belari TaxID=2138241 RepID=A0AAF3EVA1_9BILA